MTIASWTGVAGVTLLLAKSLLLLSLAFCATKVLTRAPAAARHIAWLVAIVGVLLVPLLDRFASVPLRVLPPVAVLQSPIMTPDAAPLPHIPAFVSTRSVGVVASASKPSARVLPHFTASQLALGVYVGVAIILSLRLIVGLVAVGRLARRSRVLSSADWTDALTFAAQRLDVRTIPRLVMSDEVEMAFAFDAFSPVIVVPRSAVEWPVERRRSVLLHELAHIRRRDLLGHALAGFVCAINWFNPFIWIAARQLRVESELASDEVVLGAGVRPSAYAQHLLDIVTSVSRHAPHVALAMARPKEFEGRLVAILDRGPRRASFARRQGVAIASLLALGTISIGAIAPVPRRQHARLDIPSSTVTSLPRLDSGRVDRPVVVSVERQPADHAAKHDAQVATIAPSVESSTELVAQRLSLSAVNMLLRYGTGGIVNPMMMLLRESDSLGLSGAQADSIATLNRLYRVRLNSLWQATSAYYVSRPDAPNENSLNAGAVASRETTKLLLDLLPAIDGVLTPEQRAHVSPGTARYLDPREIETLPVSSPTGVFIPESQFAGMFGRGRGGG